LAPADEQLAARADFADVARVEPAVLEGARGLLRGVEVAARDVLAAYEDLAVPGDLHVHAGHHLADGPLLRAEGMVERHDRRGLGQAVSLNNHEAQLAPERFERAIERRGADDEGPEFQTKLPVDAPEVPPAPDPVPLRARVRGLRRG